MNRAKNEIARDKGVPWDVLSGSITGRRGLLAEMGGTVHRGVDGERPEG